MTADPVAVTSIAKNDAVVAVETGSFENPDGHKIFCRYWKPEGTPKAILFLSHGYAEHCHDPRYDDLAREFAKNGFLVFAHDHVGHGKSEGPRGVCKSVDVYVKDVLSHVDTMKKRFPGVPVFLYGHSMGGLVVALTLLRRPQDFAGAVLQAPLLATDKAQATWFMRTLARSLGWLVPSLPIGSLDLSLVVKDKVVLDRMNKDPLRYHGYIRAGWAAAILHALDEVHEKYATIDVPLLIQHGTMDKLCDINGSEDAYRKVSSKDKTFKVYKDCYHGLLHEPDGVGSQILNEGVAWCTQRVTASVPAPT